MTEKQIQRVRDRIKKIRGQLAAEKRKFGLHDDSRGARYLPPGLFIKIGDYKGALTYFRWFDKNFPDDIGFPVFLFEWTLVLFKRGKTRDAEKKAFKTYCSNVHLFDAFFGRPLQEIEMQRLIGFEEPKYAEELPYSHEDPELSDFSEWLAAFERSERFQENSKTYIEIKKQLQNTPPGKERSELIERERALVEGFCDLTVSGAVRGMASKRKGPCTPYCSQFTAHGSLGMASKRKDATTRRKR